MKFWQAMKIVDEGGKVRRKEWDEWITLSEHRNAIWLHTVSGYYPLSDLSTAAFVVDDWIEIDSESDEPIQTEAYQDIDPDSTYGSFPEETDYLEEDEWGNDLSDNIPMV